MNISVNGKLLVTATKQLAMKWDETKSDWPDVKSQEFEQRFLADLLASVDHAMPVFDDLDKLLSKVRKDCE
jgi:hypothetical protein